MWVKICSELCRDAERDNMSLRDFSQANHLDKLIKLEAAVADEVHTAEGIYDRSRNKRPANEFKLLAGKKKVRRYT